MNIIDSNKLFGFIHAPFSLTFFFFPFLHWQESDVCVCVCACHVSRLTDNRQISLWCSLNWMRNTPKNHNNNTNGEITFDSNCKHPARNNNEIGGNCEKKRTQKIRVNSSFLFYCHYMPKWIQIENVDIWLEKWNWELDIFSHIFHFIINDKHSTQNTNNKAIIKGEPD